MKQVFELKKLVLVSILVAVAIVFQLATTFIPGLNFQMPQGGSPFGIGMLPIILIALLFGLPYGILAGVIYGVVSLLLDGFVLYHWASLFLDYLVAFGVLGFAGLFKDGLKNPKDFALAILFAGFLRYLSHGLSGALLFGEYAPEGVNAWYYSFFLYNLPYMIASTAFVLVIGLAVRKPFYDLAVDQGFIEVEA